MNSMKNENMQIQNHQTYTGLINNSVPSRKENIISYTFGYNRNLFSYYGLDFNSGIQGNLYSISDFLKSFYGNNIFSFQLYIEIRPSII